MYKSYLKRDRTELWGENRSHSTKRRESKAYVNIRLHGEQIELSNEIISHIIWESCRMRSSHILYERVIWSSIVLNFFNQKLQNIFYCVKLCWFVIRYLGWNAVFFGSGGRGGGIVTRTMMTLVLIFNINVLIKREEIDEDVSWTLKEVDFLQQIACTRSIKGHPFWTSISLPILRITVYLTHNIMRMDVLHVVKVVVKTRDYKFDW